MTPQESRLKEIEDLNNDNWFCDNPNGTDVREAVSFLIARIHELETLCQDLENKLKKADEIIKRNMGSSLDEVISWPKGDG